MTRLLVWGRQATYRLMGRHFSLDSLQEPLQEPLKEPLQGLQQERGEQQPVAASVC